MIDFVTRGQAPARGIATDLRIVERHGTGVSSEQPKPVAQYWFHRCEERLRLPGLGPLRWLDCSVLGRQLLGLRGPDLDAGRLSEAGRASECAP